MQLYILRHANADTEAATDDGRTLSEKGEEQARKVAQFCRRHGIQPEVILSSPLIRAHQTAKPVAKELKVGITIARWLASGAKPEEILAELGVLGNFSVVMLVGHEPDLGKLISHLLGTGAGGSVNVRKASLTLLEVSELRKGGARLEFSIPARMM